MARLGATIALATLLVAPATPATAGSPDPAGTLYALLTPPSALETGCFGPCECPVDTSPTFGSFRLVPAGVTPLYTEYDITDYIASFNNGPGAVAITGTGHYRIGGEVALVQQMTLDLSVWGGPVQHFDSGVVPVSVTFPDVHALCALHGFACHDSVVEVAARPVSTAGTPVLPHGPVALRQARPNPFHGPVVVTLSLPRQQIVDLAVVDVGGRRVRQLASGRWFAAGIQDVAWDGLRDDGRAVSAGVYWVSLHCADGNALLRVVRLP